ncbi:hypothetical protein [Tsukamurella paurometabola]|uniref:DUF4064 domain-containing protein n=1 Tax=Tsukamurella paurometabola TaxID=2061 RepID=A0A3P8K2T8_TSUPA|nr:hypothetical protein [Tsukamurella paurometabola]UEA82277.1 hypothetical protein LK411_18170 [Tsukamurella paurometabola]VDR39324.1 Uncharacterised protein [Tsukamurella paurometabola]
MTGSGSYNQDPYNQGSDNPGPSDQSLYSQNPYGQTAADAYGYQAPAFPAYGQPGYPQPGFGALVSAPAGRPGTVLAAAVLLIVVGLICAILAALAVTGTGAAIEGESGAFATGYLGATVLGLLGSVGGVVTGILLLVKRSRLIAILATVSAVLMAFTCIGLIATIAVPILLWAPAASRRWFTA